MPNERHRAYTGARADLAALLPTLGAGSRTILDVGCSNGATGRLLAETHGADVIGLEADLDFAAQANRHLARVEVGDALESIARLAAEGVVVAAAVFGDVLEHLIDPWGCIKEVQRLMPSGGFIVASVPNVAHIDTIVSLLRGTWPMRDRGIHDCTHLRFFARKDLPSLFNTGRAEIVRCERVYRLVERPHRANKLAPYLGPVWPNGFTFQFLLVVEVSPLGIADA